MDDCAEKNCDEPSEYGLTLNLNGVRVEVYLCEQHFDAVGSETTQEGQMRSDDPYTEARERAVNDPAFLAVLERAADRAMPDPTENERRLAMTVAATAIVIWERERDADGR